MTVSSTSTKIRLPVGYGPNSGSDSSTSGASSGDATTVAPGVVCLRCVADIELVDAPDFETTIDSYPLPITVVEGPSPDRVTVPVRCWYCEAHDVLLPQEYNDETTDEWLALSIRAETDQRLLAAARKSGVLEPVEGDCTDASSDAERNRKL